jgi:hypothetical protein
MREIESALGKLSLVDHHVHGALRDDAGREALENALTESDRPVPAWMTQFDSPLGFAVRRWCAPVLGLPRHASAEDYVERRAELGAREVNRRLLSASGVGHYLLDTGYGGDAILDVAGMAEAASAPVAEIVRLETVAEDLAASGVTARDFVRRYPEALAERSAGAAGLKSIVAYRHGFDFDPRRPGGPETEAAAGEWLRAVEATGAVRVEDPVLLRFLLWSGLDRGLPLQLHTGYGDPEETLHRCDPLLLTPWLKLAEPSKVDIMLLHCYPYHRHAGYLAQMFPHVYFDVGLAINHTGVSSAAVLAESLELAPFAKILFSSDACGPAELHYLGALLWRRGMSRVLGTWVADGDVSTPDALRVAHLIGAGNARRVYRLPDRQ